MGFLLACCEEPFQVRIAINRLHDAHGSDREKGDFEHLYPKVARQKPSYCQRGDQGKRSAFDGALVLADPIRQLSCSPTLIACDVDFASQAFLVAG